MTYSRKRLARLNCDVCSFLAQSSGNGDDLIGHVKQALIGSGKYDFVH